MRRPSGRASWSRSASRPPTPRSRTRAATGSPSPTSGATTTARRGAPIPGCRRRGSRRGRATARWPGRWRISPASCASLLNRGEGVLSPESFELMTTPAIEADDGWWYGCGLELREREGRREIRHGGSMPGFGTTMLGDLDSGLGVAVGVNAYDEQDLTEGVAEAILDLYRDAVAPRVRDPLAVEDAADYAGVYVGEAGRLAVSAEGDHLLLDGEPLEPRRGDRFLADRPDLSLYFLRFRPRGRPGRGGGARRRRLPARRERPGVGARPLRPSGTPTRATIAPTTPGTRTSASSCAQASCS